MGDLSSWVILAGGVIGAILTIIKACQKVKRAVIIPVVLHFEKVHQLIDDVAEIKTKIRRELSPNGGSSLVDQVKNFSKSLSRLEGLQLAILSTSDRGVWICDEKGLCVWVNQWISDTLEWLPADIYGNGWKNTVCPDDRDRVFNEYESCMKDGRNVMISFNLIHKKEPSCKIFVEFTCCPIRKADGEIIGHAAFLKPIKPII